VAFQANDPGDHPVDGPGVQIPAAAPYNSLTAFPVSVVCVAKKKRSINFRRGVQPDGTDTGGVCDYRRRTGYLSIFVMRQVSVQINVQNAARSNRLPRFQVGAYSAIVRLVAE
jgi:hypothetical protein